MKAKVQLDQQLGVITKRLFKFFVLAFVLVELLILLNVRSESISAAQQWVSKSAKSISQAVFLENVHAVSGLVKNELDKSHGLKLRISVHNQAGKSIETYSNYVSKRGNFFDSIISNLSKYHIRKDLIFNDKNIGSLDLEGDIKYSGIFNHTLLAILLIFILYVFSKKLIKSYYEVVLRGILNPVLELERHMSFDQLDEQKIMTSIESTYAVDEVLKLYEGFCSLIIRNRQNELNIQNMAANQATAKMAKQVAHDIRSPLSALNMVAASTADLPEESRLLMRKATQRINDIANSLLSIGRAANSHDLKNVKTDHVESDVIMLVALLEELVSEKRIQFRGKLDAQLIGDFSSGYGVFVNLKTSDLARALSNVINNSFEAIVREGKILVRLYSDDLHAYISVVDNGCGIPQDVLLKIGSEGMTHGKSCALASGSGLGLHQAYTVIREAGGDVKVESVVGQGTSVIIKLPLADKPSWFLDAIKLQANGVLVSIDDDDSIHQIWEDRLARSEDFKTVTHRKLLTDENSGEFFCDKNSVYLIDYEFIGEKYTGLDIIEKYNLENQAILVTSHYENNEIRQKCAQLKIKIVPKNLASSVPIVRV